MAFGKAYCRKLLYRPHLCSFTSDDIRNLNLKQLANQSWSWLKDRTLKIYLGLLLECYNYDVSWLWRFVTSKLQIGHLFSIRWIYFMHNDGLYHKLCWIDNAEHTKPWLGEVEEIKNTKINYWEQLDYKSSGVENRKLHIIDSWNTKEI